MLRGGVCGILGFSNVGVATARLMRAFAMKIHAINRRGASDEPTDWIGTTDLLAVMLRVADVLVISAALTTATEGLIDARELGLMKANAILINVARGEIIDEASALRPSCLPSALFRRHRRVVGSNRCDRPFRDRSPVSRPPERDRRAEFGVGGDGVTILPARCAEFPARHPGETPGNLIGPDERMLIDVRERLRITGLILNFQRLRILGTTQSARSPRRWKRRSDRFSQTLCDSECNLL